jgi:hypothetical protein
MTRIFLEDNELDISQNLSNQITFAIDDLRNLDSKSTSFTKTLIVPGTANNNKIFGNIFELNNSNNYLASDPNVLGNYNAMINAYARIEVNGLVIIKGHLRLLEIIRDNGGVEYECAIIGELGSFINTLGNLRLEDLDFSGYNHNYTSDNITQSWEVSGTRGANNSAGYGSGYFYPLIDYGANSDNKIDFKLNTFRPSFFVKQYIDKMFEDTDYTYESVFLNSTFFKTLIIPNNQKEFSKKSNTSFAASTGAETYVNDIDNDVLIAFPTITTSGNFIANIDDNVFTYNSATPLTGAFNVTIKDSITYTRAGSVTFKVIKNGVVIGSQITTQTNFDLSIVINEVTFNQNDTLKIAWSGPRNASLGLYTTVNIDSGNITINGVATYVTFNHDDAISVNDTIPKGIFLKDFFTSIMKMFNLMVVEDKTKRNHLIIEPYQNYFTANIIDWSDKIDRSKPIKIKPMSELNARYYNLKYTEDNDFYNENYQKVFNEGYADRVYDTTYEFNKDSEEVGIIFAPSVMVKKAGTDKVYPAIYKLSNNNVVEDRMDSKIRIGMIKKITGVASWRIKKQDGSGNWSAALTAYGYFGHVDNPTTPTIDLNFGAPLEIFFTPTSYPSANLFNTYYLGYMSEITSKDSRLVTGMFKLNEIDIYNLDFSKLIFLDGGLYKLSRVIDYQAGMDELTKVELLRIIDKTSSVVDTTASWQLYGQTTCSSCVTYQVYQDVNPYSATYENYQVNGTNIGAVPPTFGSCDINPILTSQVYNTCSACTTYLVYRNTNPCSTTYNNYYVNGIDVGATAPTNGDCVFTANWVSQGYNTCSACTTYLVYRDANPCSATYRYYQVNGINVGTTAPTNGDCNYSPVWTSQGFNTCVSCTNYLVYRDTNVCSSSYNNYQVNGVDVGSTAPTSGNCNVTQTLTSQAYYTCSACTNYLVYRDTNPCSATYNNYFVNGANVGNTAPTNGACNGSPILTSQLYTTCWDCTEYLVYRNTNPCSLTYLRYYVGGEDQGATAPEDNSCNYDANWVSQAYNTCVGCTNYLVYRDLNICSATYQNYQVNGSNVGSTAPTSGNCNTAPNFVNDGANTICMGYDLYQRTIDNNPCSSTYGNHGIGTLIEANSPTCGYTTATFTGKLSLVGSTEVCAGGEYGSISIQVVGTNLCNATQLISLPGAVWSDMLTDDDFWVQQRIDGVFKYRKFRRNGTANNAAPIEACGDC